MKLLSKLLRQKPDAEKAGMTPQQGRAIAEMAAQSIFPDGGFNGFLIAAIEGHATDAGEIIMVLQGQAGGLTATVAKTLTLLLTSPETKDIAMRAVVRALRETGHITPMSEVREDDCDCSQCIARRVLQGTERPSTTH